MSRVHLVDEPSTVASLSDFRRRVLAALETPGSATTVAERLETTRQRVNYHLRELEKAGLVELVEVRRKRGLDERIMQKVASTILLDPGALDTSKLERRDAAGVHGVIAASVDVIRRAVDVSNDASQTAERVAAATVLSEVTVETPAALNQMLREVASVVARFDTGGNGLRLDFTATVLPSPKREASDR